MSSKHNANIILSVQKKIQQSLQKLIQPSDARVLVAVSGGQDSLCLLHVMLNLHKEWNVKVIVGHTDHQWETDIGIASHLRSVCIDWGVPCFVKTPDTVLKQSEDAARKWRRAALTAIAEEQSCTYIVLGHTLTDSAETTLFNMSRGSGMKGLCGIPISSKVTEDISLVRPMLQVSRKETSEYCKVLDLPVWEDVLNSSDLYTRCRIRNQVMPLLKQTINVKAEEHLAAIAETMQETEDFMDYVAHNLYRVTTEATDVLHTPLLKMAHIAIQKRVIKLFIEANQTSAVKRCYIEDIVAMYSTKSNGTYSCLAEGNSIKLKNNKLTYHKNQP